MVSVDVTVADVMIAVPRSGRRLSSPIGSATAMLSLIGEPAGPRPRLLCGVVLRRGLLSRRKS
jgi:hypothetical protein